MLKRSESSSMYEPGRSIKLRSVISGPLTWRTMRLEENGTSWPVSAPARKTSDGVDGFKIALCALRMRSVTSDLSVMGGPNWTFWEFERALPSAAVFSCNETVHVHAASECESWHSVGHLCSIQEGSSYLVVLKDSPSASTTGTWESNARNCLYEGGFSCALPADDCDCRNIQIDVGSATRIYDLWRGSPAEVRTQEHTLE